MNRRYQCGRCESIIFSEVKPEKCSCESKEIHEVQYSKKELLGFLKKERDDLKLQKNVFDKDFLQEEIEEENEIKKLLMNVFEDICYIIEKYLDIDSNLKKIIALWIMGTHFHDDFNTYPYLYLNAMRGSGKTRLLNLIAAMSKDGSVQNSMTEAVLFRTKGTLCIDEAEGFGKKGKENLLELLNSGYKRGTKIRRMKKKKTFEGEEQVVEEFDAYRPVSLANITGIDNVLGDRCIKIILEKSVNEKKTRLVENLLEDKIYSVNRILSSISAMKCSLCSEVSPEKLYMEWNNYVLSQKTTLIYIKGHTTLTTLTTLKEKFEKILQTSINGRDLELSFPLLTIALWIDGAFELEGFFDEVLEILDEISKKKKEDESIENIDYSLYDFIFQLPEAANPKQYISIQKLTQDFREFIQTNEEWLNNKWMGRALTRLKLINHKRRLTRGIEVKLEFEKAEEKISIFKDTTNKEQATEISSQKFCGASVVVDQLGLNLVCGQLGKPNQRISCLKCYLKNQDLAETETNKTKYFKELKQLFGIKDNSNDAQK